MLELLRRCNPLSGLSARAGRETFRQNRPCPKLQIYIEEAVDAAADGDEDAVKTSISTMKSSEFKREFIEFDLRDIHSALVIKEILERLILNTTSVTFQNRISYVMPC